MHAHHWSLPAYAVYYRLYTQGGPLESINPIYSNDRFISRILSTSVRPPHTVTSLKRHLCKIENLAFENCTIYQSLSEKTASEDSTRLTLRGTPGPGSSVDDPMALVSSSERQSQVESPAASKELPERDFEQRYGTLQSLHLTWKLTLHAASVLPHLRRARWNRVKNIFRWEHSFFGSRQNSRYSTTSHCSFIEEPPYQIRKYLGPRYSDLWGWGRRVPHERYRSDRSSLWFVSGLYGGSSDSGNIRSAGYLITISTPTSASAGEWAKTWFTLTQTTTGLQTTLTGNFTATRKLEALRDWREWQHLELNKCLHLLSLTSEGHVDLGAFNNRWHSMKKGDTFHTDGVERREEWRINATGNTYGMHAYLWIWYMSFRTLI